MHGRRFICDRIVEDARGCRYGFAVIQNCREIVNICRGQFGGIVRARQEKAKVISTLVNQLINKRIFPSALVLREIDV